MIGDGSQPLALGLVDTYTDPLPSIATQSLTVGHDRVWKPPGTVVLVQEPRLRGRVLVRIDELPSAPTQSARDAHATPAI